MIKEFCLDSIVDHLEDYWFAESEDRYSLRELAEYANQQLMCTVMQNAGLDLFDGEIENTYRLLTDDDVGTGMVPRSVDDRTVLKTFIHRSGDAFGFEFDTG